MKGRPPKSNEQHKRDGTFEPSRHKNRVVAPTISGLPQAPVDFDSVHCQRWHEVCEFISGMGVLSVPDVESIRIYVELDVIRREAWARYREGRAREDWLIYRDSAEKILKMQIEFGFNPRSRMSMKVERPPKKENNAFAVLMDMAKRAEETLPDA